MAETFSPVDDAPLSVRVDNGLVVLTIGITTLASSFEEYEGNNPYDEATGEFVRTHRVTDRVAFAKDVVRAIEDEGEDGSSPLTRFLDKMCEDAVGDGSLGVDYDGRDRA